MTPVVGTSSSWAGDVRTRLHAIAGGSTSTGTTGFFDRRQRGFTTQSTAEFVRRAAAVGHELRSRGIGPGDYVLVGAASPEATWLGFLGTILAEAVPTLLPVRPTFDPAWLTQSRLRAAHEALPTAQLLLQVDNTDQPIVTPTRDDWMPLSPERAQPTDLGEPSPAAALDEPIHLQFTSGSTGALKPVVMTHGNVLAQAAALRERIDLTTEDHLVSWLPLYHDMGLMGIAMNALLNDAHLRLMTPFDFLSDPANWLQAVGESPGAVTAAPNFAFEYTTRRARQDRLDGVDLTTWKKCYCGAEPVDPRTLAEFHERFAPYGLREQVIHPTYGLAEATLMATMPRTGETPRRLTINIGSLSAGSRIEVTDEGQLLEPVELEANHAAIASLGVPALGVSVGILDQDDDPTTAELVVGEVVITGTSVTPGYLRPDGSIDGPSDGWCRTGDIGFLSDGELFLVERTKNIIIRHGQNHSAAIIEQQIAGSCGVPLDSCAVIESSIVESSNRICLVIEKPRGGFPTDLDAAIRRAVADFDLPIDDVALIGRNGIPRTTSGKKQHSRLREALRNDEIEIEQRFSVRVAEAPQEDVVLDIDRIDTESKALKLIERHARRRGWGGTDVHETHRLAGDLGFDSLALIELAVDLETTLECSVPEARLHELTTVADLFDVAFGESTGAPLTESLSLISEEIPQVYRRVDLQLGRQLRIDGRWVTDFASLNYLGLDLHPDVIAAAGPAVKEWGVHPSWTRAVASPALYFDLERTIADLVGAPDVMVFSSISLLHLGVLPRLAGPGDTLIVDRTAHNSIQEAVELAEARGALVIPFEHRDLASLRMALNDARGRTTIALNGVYSMTGAIADLRAIEALAVKAGATLYVDDAHGIGILGRDPSPEAPYGVGSGGVVQHLGLGYDNILYVGGLSKAFSSMAGFIVCRTPDDRAQFELATTSIFSGPIPVASMATALAGFRVNHEEGEARRATLRRLTGVVIDGARRLGFHVSNELVFPIVNISIGDVHEVVEASRIMWEHGILFTPSVFPAAPLDNGGFRLSLTADNTDEEVAQLLAALRAAAHTIGPPGKRVSQYAAGPEV